MLYTLTIFYVHIFKIINMQISIYIMLYIKKVKLIQNNSNHSTVFLKIVISIIIICNVNRTFKNVHVIILITC